MSRKETLDRAKQRARNADHRCYFERWQPVTFRVMFFDTGNQHLVTLCGSRFVCDTKCESRVPCRHVGAVLLNLERCEQSHDALAMKLATKVRGLMREPLSCGEAALPVVEGVGAAV